jgi:thiol-disulfide isomerase/thioredoxin
MKHTKWFKTVLLAVYTVGCTAIGTGIEAQDSAGERTALLPKVGPELLTLTPAEIEQAYHGKRMPEAVKMYLVIEKGGRMDGNSGWFGPAETRYTWDWLKQLHGDSDAEAIGIEEFKGKESAFRVLDRNNDGKIVSGDLDWSDANPWMQQSYIVNRMFRRVDQDGDGIVTQAEWSQLHQMAANEDGELTFEQLRDSFLSAADGSFRRGDAPTKEILIRGLMAGEIGSLEEGPSVGDVAPDFELPQSDGQGNIRLSEYSRGKPTVVVFGNFTCGPFRSMYPGVDTIANRYSDQAQFLAVYVREAHPTDGWSMHSNEIAGIAVSQPRTLTERQGVAKTCADRLKMSIPLLVDDLEDTVGNAYSGMPARLYVIDGNGRIAYKSGRGPFGFKAGEMEQSLQMAILESEDSTP